MAQFTIYRVNPARLAHARRARRLTQSELAARIGVHKRTVSAWERGAGAPRQTRFNALAGALGVEPFWLCGED